MRTLTAPAFLTPEGGSVYLTELQPLRGIRFFDTVLYDADGEQYAEFRSLGAGQLGQMGRALGWQPANLGFPS